MGHSAVSLWFDLRVNTGVSGLSERFSDGQRYTEKFVSEVPVGSIIIRNVYIGDFEKGSGKPAPMGFWDWAPKCVSKAACSYPLPKHWQKNLRGGWHWGEVDKFYGSPFLALSKDKPRSKKIGVIAGFKVEDFRGYDPSENKYRKISDSGFWAINDGELNLSGTWEFLNLVYN